MAEMENERRGRLKIFLGYAAGVGKSYRMLDEGRRRRERGQDVVIGAIQDECSPDIQELLQGLEIIPPAIVNEQPALATQAILERNPQVCLIDGLARNNPPGSVHAQRWQDVEELLQAGVSVITSLNIQHIEERRAEVEQIRGKKVSETVPEAFLKRADEIMLVDVSPVLLMERVGGTEAAAAEQRRLSALREIALVVAADVVDAQLGQYLRSHGIEQNWGTQERILVCLAPGSQAREMLASGRRNAQRFHGELIAAYIDRPEQRESDRKAIGPMLALAKDAGAQVEALSGDDPVEALVQFARDRGVTQIFIGHTRRSRWRDWLFGSPVDKLIQAAEGMDVRIFPHSP